MMADGDATEDDQELLARERNAQASIEVKISQE
jgi:hypothetical protein